jgi:hypothetical protein
MAALSGSHRRKVKPFHEGVEQLPQMFQDSPQAAQRERNLRVFEIES